MLSIFIIIAVCTGFSKLAFDKNRNRTAWVLICLASWFVPQVIIGAAAVIIKPSMANDTSSLNALGLVGALIGVGAAYIVLSKLPDLNEELREKDDNLLDSNL